jgi:6-phosphogluconolactonase
VTFVVNGFLLFLQPHTRTNLLLNEIRVKKTVNQFINNKLNKIVRIFHTPVELAEEFAGELEQMINESVKSDKSFTISLSGGSTPEILFKLLSEKYAGSVDWKYVHFFWGDERCVPADSSESNFGMTKRTLLDKIDIPAGNIHRIIGEAEPENEAVRYSEEIILNTEERNGFPVFDLFILGLGEDGHTASIFPGHLEYLESDKICIVASHPVTRQKRISITGRVINNAERVVFLVTGNKKQIIVEKMFKKDPVSLNYPAAHIVPVYGDLSWFLDNEAAKGL